MTRNFYGKKMFVADLTITSIWALFIFRYSLWGAWPALVFILMRIALCFEMQRKSPWVLYSAIAFTLCYLDYMWSDGAIYPFKRIAYCIGAWMGNGKDVIDAFSVDMDQDLEVWLYCLSSISGLWLIGLPLVIGIIQKNIRQIAWKKRWIWGYFAIAFCLGAWIGCYELQVGVFMEGLMLCVLPLIYWGIYCRNGRSAVEIATHDTAIVTYTLFVLFFSLCILIGKEELEFVRGVALLIMPPLFYLLACKSCGYKALTRHVVALSVCGILYYFVFTAPYWFKVITLSMSIVLALYVGIDLARRNHSIWAGLATAALQLLVVCPAILGLNPYVALDVDSVDKYYDGYYANDGIYVIMKDNRIGLRDRYGLVLEPNYESLASLDIWGRYISTNNCEGQMTADCRHGIYDIAAREFILDPDSVAVAQIIQVSENRFDLLSPDGRHFATLLLRGYHREKNEFIPKTIIEPYHEAPQ